MPAKESFLYLFELLAAAAATAKLTMESTATTPAATTPAATTALPQSTWQWDLFAGLLPVIALAPLLVYQVAALSSRDAMSFFPLAVVVWGLLVGWNMRHARLSTSSRRMWAAMGLLLLAALLYAVGVWYFAPWYAHLALILVATAWGLGRLGQRHWASVLGLSALLATTLPLPWGWDVGFSNWLQGSAAWCAAKALDAVAIPCLQNGNLVETRGMQVMADEVCGGLASVYAFAAFAITVSLLQRTSFIVGLKTLLSVPVWTLLGYFLRIFGMLMVHELWQRDLSSGWDFRLLELATTLIVLLLIWATSRLLMRIYEPIPVADAEFGPVFSGLNKLFCWPQPDPFEDLEPDDEYERQRYRKRKEQLLAARQRADYVWGQHAAAKWTVRGATLALLVCGIVPIGNLAQGGLAELNFGRPDLAREQVEPLAGEESLPESLDGGWQRRGFQFTQRNPRSRQGEFNFTWRYAVEEKQFDAAIDLPFVGWNDPAGGLEQRGWKTETSRYHAGDGWPWIESQLENELGGKALLLHTLFTSDGAAFTEVPSQFRDVPIQPRAERAAAGDTPPAAAGEQAATAVTYQFQLFSESGVELEDADRQALEAQFLELRQQAVELFRQ